MVVVVVDTCADQSLAALCCIPVVADGVALPLFVPARAAAMIIFIFISLLLLFSSLFVRSVLSGDGRRDKTEAAAVSVCTNE